MSDRLHALRLFVRVARAGSFSVAGRALQLSQPSVSRIIAGLEAEVGAALLSAITISGTPDIPAQSAFTTPFLTAGIAAFIGAACTLRIPGRHRQAAVMRAREDAALELAASRD